MADNDNDVIDTGTQDTGTEESSTTENNDSETANSSLLDAMKADPELNGDAKEDTEEAEEQQQEEEPESEDKEDSEEEQSDEEDELSEDEENRLKGKTQRRIRGLAAENRALKDQVAALEGQRNVPHTVEDYVEAGYSEQQAEMAALKEQMQVEKENARVAQLNANMNEDSVNAEHDYPVFDEKSAEYDDDFRKAVDADYLRYANIQTDPSGRYIIRADIPLYDFYKSAAERYERGLSRGRTAGAEASARQHASAEQAPSGRPAPKPAQESDVDKLLKGMRSRLPNG